MRFGCCTNTLARGDDSAGLNQLDAVASAGFDYIELPLAQMMALPARVREGIPVRVADTGIRCECCNNFFPAEVRLTGADADGDTIRRYLDDAVAWAQRLGVSVIVFGSSGAKNVPESFSRTRAYEQIVEAGRMIGESLAHTDIVAAVEPINRVESNIIHTVAEGDRLVADIGCAHVRLLADAYHVTHNGEPLAPLYDAAERIVHAHVSSIVERRFPRRGDPDDYRAFFAALVSAGYDGRVSVEGYSDDPLQDGRAAIAYLKEQL